MKRILYVLIAVIVSLATVVAVAQRAVRTRWGEPSRAKTTNISKGYVAYVRLSTGGPYCWAVLEFVSHPELYVELPHQICTDLGMKVETNK